VVSVTKVSPSSALLKATTITTTITTTTHLRVMGSSKLIQGFDEVSPYDHILNRSIIGHLYGTEIEGLRLWWW